MAAWRFRGRRKDSLLWQADAAAATSMATGLAFAIAILAFVSVSLYWILVAAGTVVSLAVGLTFYVSSLRGHLESFENRLRGRRDYKYDVFVSYRIREHEALIDGIVESLESRGLRVWSSRADPEQPWTPNLLLGLFRGLRESRAVVFLVPRGQVGETDSGQKGAGSSELPGCLGLLTLPYTVKQWLVRWWRSVVGPRERIISWWHRRIYLIDLQKRDSETWQQWERRVAEATKIPKFLRVSVGSGSVELGDESRDADPSRQIAFALHRDRFDEEALDSIEMQVASLDKVTREIPVDDRGAALFVSLFGTLLLILFIAGVVLIVVGALEGIKSAIRWPFDKVRELWERRGRATGIALEKQVENAAEDELE